MTYFFTIKSYVGIIWWKNKIYIFSTKDCANLKVDVTYVKDSCEPRDEQGCHTSEIRKFVHISQMSDIIFNVKVEETTSIIVVIGNYSRVYSSHISHLWKIHHPSATDFCSCITATFFVQVFSLLFFLVQPIFIQRSAHLTLAHVRLIYFLV